VLYTKIAHEAIELWRKPPFAPAFHETGWLTATTVTDPDKSTFKRAIENTIRYGDASRLERLDSREAIRQRVPLLSGDMAGWSAYWNGNAGWVDSSEAMRLLRDACAEAGVRFVHGSSGTLSELVRDGSGKVVGILAEDKSEFRADATILALGAWSDVHLDFEGQIASVGVMTAHVQLSEDERVKYADLPVIECEGMGYFFPPNSDGILKACDLSPGRTNFVSKKDRRQSVPFDPREPVPDTIKAQGEAAVRRLLQATLPELANTKFKEFRVRAEQTC
jgi:sarcosine oxidase / L-pipecolate oxidase